MQHFTRDFPIRELLRLVSAGELALPEFQRKFIWDPSQVIELLDSVSNGWPIGSLLLLEGPQPFQIRKIEEGPEIHKNLVKYYLLDGQQRITSLYHALSGTGDVLYFVDLAESDETGLPPFRWFRKTRSRTAPPTATSHLLADLLNTQYFKRHLAALPSREAKRLIQLHEERLLNFTGSQYQVPATVMNDDINLEALTRIFETLNRTGVRLDAFDLMVAVLYPGGFHLRDAWEQSQAEHPYLKQMKVAGLEILKLIALWQRVEDKTHPREPNSRNIRGIRQGDILNIPAHFVEAQWSRAAAAYNRALTFLVDSAAVSPRGPLPSEAMILTSAFALEAGVAHRDVERWYWQAIATERYAQGANTQVITDVDNLPALSSPDVVLASFRAALTDFSRRNRILRLGLRGLMIQRKAVDPFTGELLEIESLSEMPYWQAGNSNTSEAPEPSVVDLLYYNRRSTSDLWRDKPASPLKLDSSALRTQGFPSRIALFGPQATDWRPARIEQLSEWMRGKL